MSFILHPNLQKKAHVCELELCTVLFENNRDYPWIFLVPKKNNVRNMLDLTTQERLQLMREIEVCELAMMNLFNPTQTNVAMIGNVTPQLHVHIICRFEGDPCWPDTVWGIKGTPYTEEEKEQTIQTIKQEIEVCQKQ